jgi:hypothetical protein
LILLGVPLSSCPGNGSNGDDGPDDSPPPITPTLAEYDQGLPAGQAPQNQLCDATGRAGGERPEYRRLRPDEIEPGVFQAIVVNSNEQEFAVTFRGPPDAPVREDMEETLVCLEAQPFTIPEGLEAHESLPDIVVRLVAGGADMSTEELGSYRDRQPSPSTVTLGDLMATLSLDQDEIIQDATASVSAIFPSDEQADIQRQVEEVVTEPGAHHLSSPEEILDGDASAYAWAQQDGNLLVEVDLTEAEGLEQGGVAIGFAFDPVVHENRYPERIYYRAKCRDSVRVTLRRQEGRMRVKLWREKPDYSHIGHRTANAQNPTPPPLGNGAVGGRAFDIWVRGLRDRSLYELDGSWTQGEDTCQ